MSGAVPDGVRGRRERDDARPVGELALQVVVVERELVGDVDEADDDADVVLELEPRRDVRVVVEPRDEHLVARRERPREGARQQEVERGHALPERDLARGAAEEGRPPARGRGRRAPSCAPTSRTARRCSRCRGAGSAAIASITSSGHWVPPGPSKNASRRSSAVNRARTAATSSSVALIGPSRSYVRPRGQRGADEAVALALCEQLGDGGLVGLGLEGDVRLERDRRRTRTARPPPVASPCRAPRRSRSGRTPARTRGSGGS